MNPAIKVPASKRSYFIITTVALLGVTLVGCQTPGEKAYEEGKELRKRQQLRQAILKFEESIALFKEEGEKLDKPYQKLASIYKELGGPYEILEAIRYYELAIAEDPDDIDYHVDLMSSLSKLGQCDEAVEVYEKIKDHKTLKYDIKARTELEAMYETVTETCTEEGIYVGQPDQLELLKKALSGEPAPAPLLPPLPGATSASEDANGNSGDGATTASDASADASAAAPSTEQGSAPADAEPTAGETSETGEKAESAGPTG